MIINTDKLSQENQLQMLPWWKATWPTLRKICKWIGIIFIPIISCFSHIFFIFVTIIFVIHLILRDRKNGIQLKEAHRKLYLVDRDIKTLHSNQKMLQSSIKQIYKDLKNYGEIKRSRIKQYYPEKEESQ